MSKNRGNILIPILVVVSLAAVVFAAAASYLFWQNHQLQNKQPSIETQITVPSPTSTHETTSWKTLNSIYGYSVNYPKTWSATPATSTKQSTPNSTDTINSPENLSLELGKSFNTYDLSGVEESLSLSNASVKSKEKLSVNDNPALKVVQETSNGETTTYFVEGKYPNVYFLSISGQVTPQMQNTINQILSTFKFINTTDSSTNNWNTVYISNHNFIFQIPDGWGVITNLYTGEFVPVSEKQQFESGSAMTISDGPANENQITVDFSQAGPPYKFTEKGSSPLLNEITATFGPQKVD